MIQIDMPMPDNAETIDVAGVIQALKESHQKFSENSDMFVDKAGYKYALIDPNLILDSIALLKAQEPKPPIVKENSYGWKFYYCPSCGKEFYQNNKFSFCEKCGQAVKLE